MNFSVGVISSGSASASAASAIVASELRERWPWSRANRPFGAIFKTHLPAPGMVGRCSWKKTRST